MNRILIPTTGDHVVPPGTYAPGSYSHLDGVVVRPAVPGKVFVHGDRGLGQNNVMRFNDGCRFTLRDTQFAYSWRGLWSTLGDVTLQGCGFRHNREIGCHIGGCKQALVEDCVSEFNGLAFNPHSYCEKEHQEPSADHAYYFSYGAQNAVLRRSIGRDCQGCGLHSNRNDRDGIYCENLTVEDCQFIRCGSEGTAAIQLDATKNAILRRLLVANCHAGVALYDDGEGPEWSCSDIHFDNLTLYNPVGQFNFHISPHTRNWSIANSILVLTDARMFEGTDDGMGEIADVDHTIIYCHNAKHVPDEIIANPTNSIRAIEDVIHLFPGAPQGNFLPADPNITAGWRLVS